MQTEALANTPGCRTTTLRSSRLARPCGYHTYMRTGPFLTPYGARHSRSCCGVLEVARVAAAGFPTRYQLSDFASRYSVLLSPDEQAVLGKQQAAGGQGALQVGGWMVCGWECVAR